MGSSDGQSWHDKPWESGIFKQPVAGAVFVGHLNLQGDGQADLVNHGGPDKAINAYAWEHYAAWPGELGIAEMAPGSFGENFTTEGLVETTVRIGDVYEIGGADGALVQVSQPRQPCWKLARRWQMKDLVERVVRTGRSGWYFRVLREGVAEAGQPVKLLERGPEEWTIAAANELRHFKPKDRQAAARLAACPGLSASWVREMLQRSGGQEAD